MQLRLKPLSYYGRESGAADAIEFAKSRQASLKIALVGLGTGSLAAYAEKRISSISMKSIRSDPCCARVL